MSGRSIISLVEDGWRTARIFSLAAAREAEIPVIHYVKGRVEAAVLGMITPHPAVQLVPVPRRWFRVVSAWVLVSGLVRRRWCAVLVDNARTQQWVAALARGWRIPVIAAEERFQVLRYVWDGEPLEHDVALQRLRASGRACASL